MGTVEVDVRDSASREPLVGAAIFLTNGKDTVKMVSTNDGFAWIKAGFKKDSLDLIVSHLGYGKLTARVLVDPINYTRISVGLQEDPLLINTIIVKGDAVAMVVHGDTTIFNAAAFRQREGDQLRELLAKLPGVEVSQGGVKYQGQKVDRILINGTNLFGKEMGSAMDMVLSREVKSVQVYDQNPVEDTDTTANTAKEKVMDVKTWEPLKHVGQLDFGGIGGLYTTPKTSGGLNWFAGADMSIGSFSISEKPRIKAEARAGHNSFGSKINTISPLDDLYATVMVGRDVARKYGYTHSLYLSSKDETSESGALNRYLPSDSWHERSDSSSSRIENISRSVTYSGMLYMNRKKDRYSLSGSISTNHKVNASRNFALSLLDGNASSYDRFRGDTSNSFNGSLTFRWRHSFAKKGRALDFTAGMVGGYERGRGTRTDTLSGTLTPSWLAANLLNRTITPRVFINYSEPLKGRSYLKFSLTSDYTYFSVEDIYSDRILDAMDPFNTRAYVKNLLKNSATVSYAYGRENDGLSFVATAGLVDLLCLRDERLGPVDSWSKNYLYPSLNMMGSYKKNGGFVSLAYSEIESVPSEKQLRNIVDDSNPLFLSSGNPALKLPISRRLTIGLGKVFPEQSLNLSFNTRAQFHSNRIASRTIFFTSDTVLSEYGGYTAPAWAALAVPVNVNGSMDISSVIKTATYFNRSKINLDANLGWSMSRTPAYLADQLCRNLDNRISTDIFAVWNGKSTTITLGSTLGIGRLMKDKEKLYDHFDWDFSGSLDQFIGTHFKASVFSKWSGMLTTDANVRYSIPNLQASLSWMFGKDNCYNISVFADDLINTSKAKNVSAGIYSIGTTYNSYFGRAVGLSFKITFSRR
ncbi:MAG: outer membrane beta-barrel protein [Bacteroidales bacterium]|nr:outer membrane beta-barrel protein [Bacteroidales bacterium]